MRRTAALSTAAVAASLTLVAGLVATSADAFSEKELKACWKSPTAGSLPLTVRVSGPERGVRTLTSGNCKEWDVVAGVYTFTADANAIKSLFASGPAGKTAVCGNAAATSFRVIANVIRFGQSSTVLLNDTGGSFHIQVLKNKLSKANFRLQCTV
jgi:hypothetical protein